MLKTHKRLKGFFKAAGHINAALLFKRCFCKLRFAFNCCDIKHGLSLRSHNRDIISHLPQERIKYTL